MVRTVRGRKMRTTRQLFDECGAALQFPDYFGENFAALDECLADLDWLPMGAGLVLRVTEPSEVLADEDDEALRVLVSILAGARATFAEPVAEGEWWDRPAIPFHVVLDPVGREDPAAEARWRAAGARLEVLAGLGIS